MHNDNFRSQFTEMYNVVARGQPYSRECVFEGINAQFQSL